MNYKKEALKALKHSAEILTHADYKKAKNDLKSGFSIDIEIINNQIYRYQRSTQKPQTFCIEEFSNLTEYRAVNESEDSEELKQQGS